MTEPEFRSERVLHLRGYRLHPEEEPFKSFKDDYLKYFDRVKFGLMVRIDSQCDEYWPKIVSHVKELDVDMRQFDVDNINVFPLQRYVSLLVGMTSLKRLDITNISSFYSGFFNDSFIKQLTKQKMRFVIEELNLKFYKIHIKSLEMIDKIKRWLPKFINLCDNLKKINIERVSENFSNVFGEVAKNHEAIEFNIISAPAPIERGSCCIRTYSRSFRRGFQVAFDVEYDERPRRIRRTTPPEPK